MSTPHIGAAPGAFAPIVILLDDPLQARLVADRHLDDVKEVTTVRNMQGYTGTYKDKALSVMGVGLGIPSVSIYARELFLEYGVEAAVSIGECHAVNADISVRDLILAMGASTFSGVNRQRFSGGDFAAICDFELLRQAWDSAVSHALSIQVGNICTTDFFHISEYVHIKGLQHMGILGLDMNAAGLYGAAAESGRKALALYSVSKHVHHGDCLPDDDREQGFRKLLQIALDVVEDFNSCRQS